MAWTVQTLGLTLQPADHHGCPVARFAPGDHCVRSRPRLRQEDGQRPRLSGQLCRRSRGIAPRRTAGPRQRRSRGTYDVTSVVRLSPRRPVPVRRFPPQTVTRIARLLARSMAFAPNLARRRTFIRARSRNAVSISVRLADARSALPSRLSPAEALTTPSRWWTARTSRWLASATVVNLLGLQL